MILKFARYGAEKQIRGVGRWQFIDCIEDVSTFPVFIRRVERQPVEGDKGDPCAHVLKCFLDEAGTATCEPDLYSVPRPAEERVLSGDKESLRVTGVLIMSREKVGRTVVLYAGYLLNDEGKTIERL